MTGHRDGPFKVIPAERGNKQGWAVLAPGGYWANDYLHKDEDEADKHCAVCNAFWWAWNDPEREVI
jgi:hypothetical protein